MFLTRLLLDSRSSQARRDLANACEMHRTLVRAFVCGPDDVPERFLWRLETDGDAHRPPALLLQSSSAGRWAELENLPGYLHSVEAKQLDLERFVVAGRRFSFRLLANPNVTRQGKRRALLDEPAQHEWLQRQGQRHGFILLGCAIAPQAPVQGPRNHHAELCIHRVRYDGVLQVADKAALRAALLAGIGAGKAVGCGMLSLKPIT